MAILGDHSLDQEPSPLITPGGAGCGLFTPHKTVEIGMESEQTLTVAAKAPKSSATQTHIQAHKNGSTFSKPSASQVHTALEGAASKVKGKGKGKSDGSEGGSCFGCLVWAFIIFFVIGVFGAVVDDCDSCDACVDSCIEDFLDDDFDEAYSFGGPGKGEFLDVGQVVYFDSNNDDEQMATYRVSFTENGKGYVDLDDDGEYGYGESAFYYRYYYYDDNSKRRYIDLDGVTSVETVSGDSYIQFLDKNDDGKFSYKEDVPVYFELERMTEDVYNSMFD